MKRTLQRATGSLLILAMSLYSPARGDNFNRVHDSGREGPFAPAGTLESLGTIRIDGRIVPSGSYIGGTELLQAPARDSVRIRLRNVGEITLRGSSAIQFISIPSLGGIETGQRTLFACLVSGDMTIKVNARAGARICAGNTVFAFSPESQGRLLMLESRGRLLTSTGTVGEIADWRDFRATAISSLPGQPLEQEALSNGPTMTPGEYKIQPYNFTFGLGGYADIEARSTRYVQFRVTDKDDRPVPDLLLLVLLKNHGGRFDAGSINYEETDMRVTTDQNGIATMRFDAGIIVGATASLDLTVAKNQQVFRGNLRLVKPKGFWTMKNAGPVMATVLTTAIAVAITRPFGREIPPQPPLNVADVEVIP